MYAYEHDFSKEDVQTWLDRQRKRYKEYGFGLWAMILKETNEKIYVVAQKVGYLESGYFSHVFKKKYGMSPIQCRRQGQ